MSDCELCKKIKDPYVTFGVDNTHIVIAYCEETKFVYSLTHTKENGKWKVYGNKFSLPLKSIKELLEKINKGDS